MILAVVVNVFQYHDQRMLVHKIDTQSRSQIQKPFLNNVVDSIFYVFLFDK